MLAGSDDGGSVPWGDEIVAAVRVRVPDGDRLGCGHVRGWQCAS